MTTVEIELLKRDVESLQEISSRLCAAIEDVNKTNNSIERMIALHEERITISKQGEIALREMVETHRKSVQVEIQNQNTELLESIGTTEHRIMEQLEKIEKKIDQNKEGGDKQLSEHEERLVNLENWRWMLVGGGIVLGVIFIQFGVPLVSAAAKLFTQ